MDTLKALNFAQPIADTYNALEIMLLRHIAEQLAANPDTLINATSKWRIKMLAQMGRLDKSTAKIIANMTGKAKNEVKSVVNTAINEVLAEYGLERTKRLSENILGALKSYDRQAVISKYNQVNTVMQYKAKQLYASAVNGVADRFDRIKQKALDNAQEYLDVLNENALAVAIGERSRTEALRETIAEMSRKGIPAFVDAAGREWSPEAYINMDIRNTAKNAALAAEFSSLEELGQDVVLISSHSGARPKCFPYQGKFFSLSGKSGTITDANGKTYTYSPLSETSYGEPDGLLGINCGHRMRGVSDGGFINREKEYDEGENSKEYEQVQRQRTQERRIRKEKTQAEMLEAAGDKEGAKEYRNRAALHQRELKQYCEDNGLRYRKDRTETYGYVDKSGESGIIKAGSGKVTIHAIDLPIEQRNTGKGNPNAILHFDVELNDRQSKILEQLPEYDSRIIVPKRVVNMTDLAALTAKTGDEFAMFTKGNERLIIRGNTINVNVDVELATNLAADGYRWSGHTHPGTDFLCLEASDGDWRIFRCFSQNSMVIYNSKGQYRTFKKE